MVEQRPSAVGPFPSEESSMPNCALVLWDIDHTLIETRGVGSAVFAEAFEAATGRPMANGMATALGHTEPVLLEKTLRLNGIHEHDDGLFGRFAHAQAAAYRARADELRSRGRVLPGVENALEALSRESDVVQTVLTGNTRQSAEIKLAVFGVDRWLNLDVGAYGDDDEDRSALVRIARQRTEEQLGQAFRNSEAILVGDTPRDVETGRVSGARVIAVASGASSSHDLASAGADRVLESLEGTDMRALLSDLVRSS